MNRLLFAGLALVFVMIAFASESVAQEMAGVKCIVDGDRNANEQFAVAYADGEVYFCCKACAATFAADTKDFQTRANHQLVVMGQYKQIACPIAGENLDPKQTTNVSGVEVAFCCENSKKKVNDAKDPATKAELVFGPAAFKRAFAKPDASPAKVDLTDEKCVVDPKRSANEKFAADYRGGKVYFCCGGCLKSYQANPAKFSTQANLQLVSTKQFTQTKCPITDGDTDESKTVSVGGQEVALCCGSCQEQVAAASKKERVAMIFDDAVFEKSFSKVGATEEDYSVAPEELGEPGK